MRLTKITIYGIIKAIKNMIKLNKESKYSIDSEKKMKSTKRSLMLEEFDFNSELCRTGEMPSANGHSNARSMALIASVMS